MKKNKTIKVEGYIEDFFADYEPLVWLELTYTDENNYVIYINGDLHDGYTSIDELIDSCENRLYSTKQDFKDGIFKSITEALNMD